jgi:hypothetical protein
MRVISIIQSERIAYEIMDQSVRLLALADRQRPPWGIYRDRFMELSKERLRASGALEEKK